MTVLLGPRLATLLVIPPGLSRLLALLAAALVLLAAVLAALLVVAPGGLAGLLVLLAATLVRLATLLVATRILVLLVRHPCILQRCPADGQRAEGGGVPAHFG